MILIPLGVPGGRLAPGRASPFKEFFAGHDVADFFRDSLQVRRGNHILEDMHHVPLGVALAADRDDGARLPASPGTSTSASRRCRSSSRASTTPLYRFLLNKWYFDELYDFIFVRPAMWLGRLLWKRGDGWHHRRLRA